MSRKSDIISGQGTMPEPSTSHIGQGVALDAPTAVLVYIYARISQIAEIHTSFYVTCSKSSFVKLDRLGSTSSQIDDLNIPFACRVRGEQIPELLFPRAVVERASPRFFVSVIPVTLGLGLGVGLASLQFRPSINMSHRVLLLCLGGYSLSQS